MEDLSALASRIAVGIGDLRGCLILSRDGLVLGSYPPDAEASLKPAWLKFATLGEAEKGFVQFADELWVFVHRGPYSAFASGEVSIRPGLLIDQLEQALLIAEESRSKREALKIPEAPAAPTGKPRTSLHKEPKTTPEPAPTVAPMASLADALLADLDASAGKPPPSGSDAEPPKAPAGTDAESPPTKSSAPPEPAAAPESPPPAHDHDDEGEVDRVLLAQEFSRLLQESSTDDEA
jgi:hypothetical protein